MACGWTAIPFRSEAAPFAKQIPFTQPDGTKIQLWGQGDEFHADFETLDGYTVVFDPERRAYCFASASAGGALVSSGIPVGSMQTKSLAAPKHLRASAAAVQKDAAARRARWDLGMDISHRWPALKAAGLATMSKQSPAPPDSATIGTKVGLCLLVDFDDDPATIPQAEIVNFCNGDNYSNYGNHGSVKNFYLDNSNGLLLYTNVVTVYIRIPNSLHPKSYYNDVLEDAGYNANLLIQDAIGILKSLPNYETEILPTFNALTVDANNEVVACNVFYAGDNGGVWTMGLWPHSFSLYYVGAQELSPGGKSIWRYQVSNIGDSLEIGTFCHENGHMLCGYPDLYDYDYDSSGGAGNYCIMAAGSWNGVPSGSNPSQVCAYLKRASGWATTTDLTAGSSGVLTLTATAGTNFNHFYRFQKPATPTEYYLLECRYRTGHDLNIPGSGVAIWHVDELGDRDNQSLLPNTTHANYELTLVQADNLWQLEHNINDGDAMDVYYKSNPSSGYANQFTDNSAPAAHWWDGTASGINLHDFTAASTNMFILMGSAIYAPVIDTQPVNQSVLLGGSASFQVGVSGIPPFRYQWRFNNTNINGATGSTLTLSPVGFNHAGLYSLVVSNDYAGVTSTNARLTVTTAFSNYYTPGSITIPNFGPATTYPLTNFVTLTGEILKATVTLSNLSHTYPSDLQVLLVSPQGQTVLLMSGAGSYDAIANYTLTFDDDAAGPVPPYSWFGSGSYQPSQYGAITSLPGAPPMPYGTTLSVLQGANPTGTWLLYINDDSYLDGGTLTGGWQLNIALWPPVQFASWNVTGNQMQLLFGTRPGLQYLVEYKDSLGDAAWQTLQTVTGNGSVMTVQDALQPVQRYYRLSHL
ncbi:MAG: M6 family metalloprotease domain-containing protein [Verrucomicrobiota bacterium]